MSGDIYIYIFTKSNAWLTINPQINVNYYYLCTIYFLITNAVAEFTLGKLQSISVEDFSPLGEFQKV